MRRVILLLVKYLLLTVLLVSCKRTSSNNNLKNRENIGLKFLKDTYDFGEVFSNNNLSANFIFKNLSKKPVITGFVKSSCGCVISSWSRKPINQGSIDTIKISYNAPNRTHLFIKTAFVYFSGSKIPKELKIKGAIIKNKY